MRSLDEGCGGSKHGRVTLAIDLLDAALREYGRQAFAGFHQLPRALAAKQQKDRGFELAKPILDRSDVVVVLGAKLARKRMYVSEACGPCFLTTDRAKLVRIDAHNLSKQGFQGPLTVSLVDESLDAADGGLRRRVHGRDPTLVVNELLDVRGRQERAQDDFSPVRMADHKNRPADGVDESCDILELSFDRIVVSVPTITSPTSIHAVNGESLFEHRTHHATSSSDLLCAMHKKKWGAGTADVRSDASPVVRVDP